MGSTAGRASSGPAGSPESDLIDPGSYERWTHWVRSEAGEPAGSGRRPGGRSWELVVRMSETFRGSEKAAHR